MDPHSIVCGVCVYSLITFLPLSQDQKKLQGQLLAEQEALYGSKPSPSKPQSVKKAPRMSTGGASNRRLSLGGAMHQTPKPDSKATPHSRAGRKSDRVHHNDQLNCNPDDGFTALSTGKSFYLYFILFMGGALEGGEGENKV